MNWTLRNALLLEGGGVNQNEDARVADAPDKRAPDINRQVHAQADPDKGARVKAAMCVKIAIIGMLQRIVKRIIANSDRQVFCAHLLLL